MKRAMMSRIGVPVFLDLPELLRDPQLQMTERHVRVGTELLCRPACKLVGDIWDGSKPASCVCGCPLKEP